MRFVNEGFIKEIYGRMLAKGMQVRERVDYDVYYKASREEAREILKEAQDFIQRIEEALMRILESD